MINKYLSLMLDPNGTVPARGLQAMHDSTTGLANRELFEDRLTQAICLANRHGWMLAVMCLDLDRFKSMDDTHGHVADDCVLKEVAWRLSRHCRAEDTLCRNGRDEFLYLLLNPLCTANIETIARRVLDDIAQPMRFDGHEIVVRPSIGIAAYPDGGATGPQLIGHADTAKYRAKKQDAGFLLC
jgi:diguanylate cyclase (GGDEF)-like protein